MHRALLSMCSGVILICALDTSAADSFAPYQERLRGIYKELVEINTTNSSGSCTEAAQAMANQLQLAGFSNADTQVIIPDGAPKKGNLVARHRGKGSRRPILFLAHIDVVEAKREDWKRDPFRLIEENGYFYARGSLDDKAMAAILVANLIRYREEGYIPERDLIVALTCDEELVSLTNGVEHLLKHHRNLIDAEYVINEGGYGLLDNHGNPVNMGIQAGEKGVLHFILEVTNPGGHSSRPSPENAIYRLANALIRLEKHVFPANLSPTTKAYFERMAAISAPEVGADMRAILQSPPDAAALSRLSQDLYLNAMLRTTCVATMAQAGHAMNALPQRATAQVNCRVLPNDSIAEIEKQFIAVINDERVSITRAFEPTISPLPTLNPELLREAEAVTGELWPGIPVIPTLFVAATDGRFLNSAGLPTFGLTGLFRDSDGSGVHGLDERIRVKALFDGHEFLYRLGKRVGSRGN